MIVQEFVDRPGGWHHRAPTKLRNEAYDGGLEWRIYSTSRFLGASDGAIHSVIPGVVPEDGPKISVEILSDSLADHWRSMGLRFATAAEAEGLRFRELMVKAIALIREVDPFSGTVVTLCRSVHPLVAPHADTDVSYSDPALPFSVFVSAPPPAQPDAVERLAENLVHEALHLQLSLVERILPMVVSNPGGESEQVFSPWAGEGRTVRGLLHGVYVFGNLRCFWERVAEQVPAASGFSGDRIAVIEGQMIEASHLRLCAELTPAGRRLATVFLAI